MSQIFLNIINMSISASYIVVAVILLRLVLKKAPKWITVLLWGIVAVRLICPFSPESVLSLIPSAEVVSPDIMMDRTPEIHTGITIVNSVVNPVISEAFTPAPTASANPLQIWIPIFTAIWSVGVVSLLIYTIISYLRIRRKVGTAVLLRDNIYQSENVISPFVLGIIKPKIYLPFHMNDMDMAHVVSHEQAHIRRKDYLWKPLGFILLTLHWFNPLMWLGYILLCRDIELACDEKVIGVLGNEARADYSEALLSCSVNRRMISACPLAFGEVGVKNRIKNVLSYKKPAFWIIIVAVISCIVVAVCFLTDPKEKIYGETDVANLNETQISLLEKYPEYFGLDASDGLDVYVWQMARNSYYFGLLSHSEYTSDRVSTKLMSMRGTSVDDMRTILSTYNVEKDDIYIIPWQNPLSSYIGEYWIIKEGEDINAKREEYVENIREMLFDSPQNNGSEPNNSSIRYVFPSEKDSDKSLSIYIQDYGCDVKDVSIDFKQVRFEDGNIIFDILWRNEGADYADIGPRFNVYKYNDTSLEMLESDGIWLDYIQMLGGKETFDDSGASGVTLTHESTVSYNLSAYYDIMSPGKYRFEVYGAWIEFQIISVFTSSLTYDTAIFDIDNDGIDEICSMSYGRTSGIFTFIFDAREIGDEDSEYQAVFWSQWYDLSFQKGSDGITRVQGITQGENPEVHLFDISISDGNVNLTENGVPIGEVRYIEP